MASGEDSKSLQRVLEVNCIFLMLVYADFKKHLVYRDPMVPLSECSNASCNVEQIY